ncbi:hypothetical protein NLU13_3874 [Sarocladium strictum]|uniref:Tubulin-specific chaperone A n=1 Tax=Sarocladium strictum TaxID=5046 RepID=A0AA39GJ76_SARSR|nr:hypothetical protein NLU13_3874 [Sarocladium strictum]
MPAPSQLSIATSAVRRLLKEESTYHKELVTEEQKLKDLEQRVENGEENEDGNAEFILNQHRTAVEQTKAVFAPLRKRIEDAVTRLEEQIAIGEENGANETELEAAKQVLKEGQKPAANGASA